MIGRYDSTGREGTRFGAFHPRGQQQGYLRQARRRQGMDTREDGRPRSSYRASRVVKRSLVRWLE